MFLSGNLTDVRHNHVAIVSRGQDKPVEIRSKLEKKEAELKCSFESIFKSKNKLRVWATERYDFSKGKLDRYDSWYKM